MQAWMILALWVVYLALTDNLQLSNLVVGLAIAIGLTWLLHPDPRRIDVRRLPAALAATLRYALVVVIDVLRGGLQVAQITLNPRLPIRPGIIAIPTGTDSELATALSADAITLSPGEMVVEISRDGVMYTHALECSEAEAYVAEAQQQREDMLSKILP
ncbi:MAG: Na+/H+ antiporter subunit E [Caldilineales bacterium]